MKILTKEEEQQHYNETLKGGFLGGSMGIVAATVGVYAGSLRFPMIRHLTLPMKAFLVTSGGTFAAITTADHFSRGYEAARNPTQKYKDENERLREEMEQQQTAMAKAKDWIRERRYQLVGGSWVASIAAAFALVNRDKYLTAQQKIVQARVYAQGFTLLVMVALAAFEIGDRKGGKGRWETVKIIDPEDPEHKRVIEKQVHHESYEGEDLWRDMVETEERKLKQRKKHVEELEKQHHDKDESNGSNGSKKKKSKPSASAGEGGALKGGEPRPPTQP